MVYELVLGGSRKYQGILVCCQAKLRCCCRSLEALCQNASDLPSENKPKYRNKSMKVYKGLRFAIAIVGVPP